MSQCHILAAGVSIDMSFTTKISDQMYVVGNVISGRLERAMKMVNSQSRLHDRHWSSSEVH